MNTTPDAATPYRIGEDRPDPLARLRAGDDAHAAPGDPETDAQFAELAHDFSAEIRAKFKDTYGGLKHLVAPKAPYTRDRDYLRVELERVMVSPDELAMVFRVRLVQKPTAKEKRHWAKVRKSWDDAALWRVTDLGEGDARVRRLLSTKEFRRTVAEYLGEERAEDVPLTIARPVAPGGPVTFTAIKLMASKVASRQGGEVPIDWVRQLVDALPGWSWRETVYARPFTSGDGGAFARRVDPSASLSSQKSAPTTRPTMGWTAVLYKRDSFSEADLERVRGVMTVDSSAVANGPAPTGVHPGAYLARGMRRVFDDEKAKKPVHYGWNTWVIAIDEPMIAMRATVVRAPDGAELPIYHLWSAYGVPAPRRGQTKKPVEFQPDASFWTWGYRRGLGQLSEGVLAGLNVHVLRYALRPGLKEFHNTGECQLCTNGQKLHGSGAPATRVMVDHGYRYPHSERFRGGLLGERHYHCEGVGAPPCEVSWELLKALLPGFIREHEESLRALRTVERMYAERQPLHAPKRWVTSKRDDTGYTLVTAEHPNWDGWMQHDLIMLRIEERAKRQYVEWVRHRIDTWVRRPLYDELTTEQRKEYVPGMPLP